MVQPFNEETFPDRWNHHPALCLQWCGVLWEVCNILIWEQFIHSQTHLLHFCFTLFHSPGPTTSPPLPGTTTRPPHTTTSPSPGTSTGTVVSPLSVLVAVLSTSPWLATLTCPWACHGCTWMYLSPAGHGEKVAQPPLYNLCFPFCTMFSSTHRLQFCLHIRQGLLWLGPGRLQQH